MRKTFWAVVSNEDDRIIDCCDGPHKPAIFYGKADAARERERRYTFRDQMERETRVKRVFIG